MVDKELLNLEELETLVSVKRQLNNIIIKSGNDLYNTDKNLKDKIYIVSTANFDDLAFSFTDKPFEDIKKAFQEYLDIDIGTPDFHFLVFKDIDGVNSFLKGINISHFLLFIKDNKEEALIPILDTDFKSL